MAAIGISRTNVALIKKKYDAIAKGNVRLTQSSLRLIQPINAAKASYTFPVLENDGAILADETRLNINDEFTITSMGIYLKGTLSEAEGAIKTPYYFTFSPIQNSIQHAKSEGLYDGKFRLSVNNINYIENWAVKNHEYIPAFSQWQKPGVGLSLSSQQPAARYLNDAKVPFSPMVVLSGAKKNELTISLPTAIAGSLSSWADNAGNAIEIRIDQICIQLDGMLAQNAARFQ